MTTTARTTASARDIVSFPPITIRQDASFADAAGMTLAHNLGALQIVDDDRTFVG